MSPDRFYFLAMALIVVPLLPFTRMAVVIAGVWAVGQLAYSFSDALAGLAGVETFLLPLGGLQVPLATLTEMMIAIVALGAGLALAETDDDRAIAILYLPTAAVHFSAACGYTDAFSAWWLDYAFAMARVALLPITADWQRIGDVLKQADAWIMARVSGGRRLDQW